jgi:hypothetical protein
LIEIPITIITTAIKKYLTLPFFMIQSPPLF